MCEHILQILNGAKVPKYIFDTKSTLGNGIFTKYKNSVHVHVPISVLQYLLIPFAT